MRGTAASGDPGHGGLMDRLRIGVGDRLRIAGMVGVHLDRTGAGERQGLTGAGNSLVGHLLWDLAF